MSIFNPGTGGDLKSTNVPGALFELSQILSAAELAIPAETRPNNITMAIDLEGGIATITAALPVTATLDSTGKVVVSAVDYL